MFWVTVCLVWVLLVPFLSQVAAQSKEPIYIYVAEWDVPRLQWGEIAKLDEQDRPVMDKLVADGTLIGYGAYSNLIHQEGEPTHGTWFSANSEGKLLKALEAVYAQAGLVSAPVQAASKHWDQIFAGEIYNNKPGASTGGYLTWSTWQIKAGSMRDYIELTKKIIVPELDKLLADGTITSYGELVEEYHQGKMGVVYEYLTVPDAASMDKVNKTMERLFQDNPGLPGSIENYTSREGHRDFLARIRFMVNK